MPPRLRKTRLSHRRRPALRHNRRLRTLRRLFAPSSRQSARRLTACERCGFVSGRRAVVDRHRRLCAGGDTCSLSCERCAWIGDTVTMYVEHRREAHGDRITVFKYASLSLSLSLSTSLSYSFVYYCRYHCCESVVEFAVHSNA